FACFNKPFNAEFKGVECFPTTADTDNKIEYSIVAYLVIRCIPHFFHPFIRFHLPHSLVQLFGIVKTLKPTPPLSISPIFTLTTFFTPPTFANTDRPVWLALASPILILSPNEPL